MQSYVRCVSSEDCCGAHKYCGASCKYGCNPPVKSDFPHGNGDGHDPSAVFNTSPQNIRTLS